MFDGNATDVGFTSLDGDDIVLFEDLDGSVTGSAGNFVVKPLPIHMTEQCEEIDNWKMAVCPHPFGQVRRFFCVFDFYFRGTFSNYRQYECHTFRNLTPMQQKCSCLTLH